MIQALVSPKLVTVAVLVAAALFLGGVLYHKIEGRGYARHKQEMEKQDLEADLARSKDDRRVSGLTDYELCVDYYEPRGLQSDCEPLRRVYQE